MSGTLETPTMRDVLVAVSALPGGMFWRQNAGTFLTLDGRRKVKVSVNGVGDIMGVYRGRAVAIETKSLEGEQRETQERFQRAFERAGGLYVIARSAAEALSALEAA